MFTEEECYHIGYFSKTHGVKGELNIKKNSDLLERYKLESVLVDIDGGLVPFFISEIGGIKHESLRLRMTDVDCESKAKRFVGCNLFVPISDAPNAFDDEEFTLDLLIGFTYIDEEKGELAKIEDILDYSGNTIFQLTINNEEVLIPFNDENLVEVNEEDKSITMITPEGLLDLYLS